MLVSKYAPTYHTMKELWQTPKTFATVLLTMFLDQYGKDGLSWTPANIVMQIEDDFGINMPQVNIDKLMASLMVIQSDSFFWSLPDFITICNVFSGSAASAEVFDPADAYECAWGITEAVLLYPPEQDEKLAEKFSPEITAYVGEISKFSGLITLPDVLRIGMGAELTSSITYDYSDDPEMFGAIWDFERERTDDINNMIRQRLIELFRQLESVQLSTGDTSEIAQKMLEQLNKHISHSDVSDSEQPTL